MERTPGADAGKGLKYEFSVIALFASALSLNEKVDDYRIYSNAAKYKPFDDVVAKVHFKGSKQAHTYVVQTKSGNDKFDIDKYFVPYTKIMETEDEERIQFWYFAVKNIEYFSRPFEKQRLTCEVRRPANPKDILYNTPSFKLTPKNSNHFDYGNFLDNFYLYLDQPDSEAIQKEIKKEWKIDTSPHLYIEKYFTNSMEGLDKESFEHELLKIRLGNYTATPTKAIEIQHVAVNEWNRLTLGYDVTIIRNEFNIEQYLFGCILQLVPDIINIENWNTIACSEGILDSDYKNQLKKPYKPETIKELIVQMWEESRAPLILKTDAPLPVLKEFAHLKKKYIIIDSNPENRSTEMESYGLKVFKHLDDVATTEIMKSISVSVQGRKPTSLYAIINEDEKLKKDVTCLDIINFMKPRELYLKRECLENSEYTLFIVETTDLQQPIDDEHGPTGSNIAVYCAPNESESNYIEKRVNTEFKNYRILRIRSIDNDKLKLIPRIKGQYDEEYRGLECSFVDQNGESVYYTANGTIVPVIGKIPIRTDTHFRWKYIPRHLREVIKDKGRSIGYNKQMLAEKDFFKECGSKVNVITGEPGMGKTTLLHSLVDFCESKYYVLFVDLARIRGDLLNGKLKSVQDILKLSRNKCRSLRNNCFLNTLHGHTNRFVLMLDSFDEIVPTCKKEVLKLVKSIQGVDFQNVIIASRVTTVNLLIDSLEAKVFKMEGLDKQSDKRYTDDWNLDINNLRHIPSELLTTPLYLNMLRDLSENGINLIVVNRWNLYQSVLELKMKEYSQRHNLDEDEKQSLLTKHSELALDVIFGINIVKKKVEHIGQLNNFNFIRLGFITRINNENPVFVHRTFAEFFAVKWLIQNVDHGIAGGICSHMFYNNEMRILNMYSENFPLHTAVLEDDIDEVRRLCKEDKRCLLETDAFGRNALHLTIISPLCASSPEIIAFLLRRMRNEGCDIHARDKLRKWRWIDYYEWYSRNNYENVHTTIKEAYLNYYAIHIEELKSCRYSLSKDFIKLYDEAVCHSSISLVRDLLFLKYHKNSTFLEFRQMCLGSREIRMNQIELSEEKLKGMHLACIYGSIEVLQVFIESGADFTQADEFNCTPLHYSVMAEQRNEMVKLLLCTYGIANPYAGRHNDTTILNMCIRTDDVNITKMVLERINIHSVEEWNTHSRYSPLQLAIKYENNDMVELFLHRLNPNRIKRNLNSFLASAFETKNGDIIQTLLKYGADVNTGGNHIGTPLYHAILARDMKTIESLLQHGEDANYMDRRDWTPLTQAISWGADKETVQILLNYKADVNLKGEDGETPLCMAIKRNKLKIVELLLTNGARLDCLNSRGWTPLIYAIMKGRTNIVRILLDGVNLKGKHGVTPLCTAIELKNTDIIQMLLDHQADVNSVDEYGLSPLIITTETRSVQIAEMLLDKGADVDFKNEYGITALYAAAFKRNVTMVELLLRRGADVNFITSGEEILRKVKSAGKIEVVVWLLKNFTAGPLPSPSKSSATDVIELVAENWPCINLPEELCTAVNQQSINFEILKGYGRVMHIENKFWKAVFYLVNEMNNKQVDDDFFGNFYNYEIENLMKICSVASCGNSDIVRILLRHRVKCFQFLRTAIELEDKEIIEIILKNADVRSLTSDDTTLLHIAVRQQNTDIVKMLLEHGIAINSIDSNSLTALFHAVIVANIEIVKVLLTEGADIDFKIGKSGLTALHIAALKENRPMVRTLLENKGYKHEISEELLLSDMGQLKFLDVEEFSTNSASEIIDKVKRVIEEESIEMQKMQ